jgi:hypothetical protein
MKKRKAHLDRVTTKPKHEKLPWPGLKAKDHLSRVATRAVKEAKETRENEVWAENVIARVLDYVQPETAIRLLLQETDRRGKPGVKRQTLAKRAIGFRVALPATTAQQTRHRPAVSKRK